MIEQYRVAKQRRLMRRRCGCGARRRPITSSSDSTRRRSGCIDGPAALRRSGILESAGISKTIVQYKRGDVIFTQGDLSKHVM
jgi:hypothetical protein